MSVAELIAAHPDPADPRRSLYSLADAERLLAAAGARPPGRRGCRKRHLVGRGGAADRDLDGCRRAAVLSRPRRGEARVPRLAGGSRRAAVGRAGVSAAVARLLPFGRSCRRSRRRFRCWPRPPRLRPDARAGRGLRWSPKRRCCCARLAAALGADLADGGSDCRRFCPRLELRARTPPRRSASPWC